MNARQASNSNPRKPLGVGGERRRERLDRDFPAETGIAGAIDLAHSASSDEGLDLVPAENGARLDDHESWPILGGSERDCQLVEI